MPSFLAPNHKAKAKMVATRLRRFAVAVLGNSDLKVGPNTIASAMNDAAKLFELMIKEGKSKKDDRYIGENPGKYFICHGRTLIHMLPKRGQEKITVGKDGVLSRQRGNQMPIDALVPADHPMMKAWEKYKQTEEYRNSFKWAADLEHRPGSMWAAFVAGFESSTKRTDGSVPDRETWWLVERKVSPPQYVVGTCSTLPIFNSDPWRAGRFATEREAFDFRLRMVTMRDDCKETEHVFINKPNLGHG